MKFAAAILSAVFCAWFWKTPSSPEPGRRLWPAAVPVFAQGCEVDFSSAGSGGAAFVSFRTAQAPDAVLESARGAFAAAGWEAFPVRTSDMLVFGREEAVAAVLAQDGKNGVTRVTAIVRR